MDEKTSNSNHNIIKIPESLRDFIQRLFYEKVRYTDLLSTVRRDFTTFTDEEWEESIKYFEKQLLDATYSFNFGMEFIYDLYQDQIKDAPWEIDFDHSCILLNGEKDNTYVRKEDYSNFISRIYDDCIEHNGLSINNVYCRNITLQVTDDCNMRCTYCYQHDKGKHMMSYETAKEFIDMIFNSDERVNTYIDANKTFACVLDFIGGEPLIAIDMMDKLCDYFIGELFRRKHHWAIRYMISMSSNGLLYFGPKVQTFIKKHINHISYGVSVDGNKTLHDACRLDINGNGTYDRAIAAVKDFVKLSKRKPESKVTLSPNNVDFLAEAVESLIENGYEDIYMNCVFEEGWEIKHATIMYNRLKELTDWLEEHDYLDKVYISMFDNHIGHKQDESDNQNWCGGLGLMISLDYKGNIYPCMRYMENAVGDKQEAFIIGNLKEGININPEHQKRVELMSKINRRTQSTDECFYCPIGSGCAWCSAYNYETFGTPDKRATFICEMHKARVLANKYYWSKRGEEYSLNVPPEWAIPIIGEEEFEKLKVM